MSSPRTPGRRDRRATAIALLAVTLKGAALAALAWWWWR